jgi:hypothetical protein
VKAEKARMVAVDMEMEEEEEGRKSTAENSQNMQMAEEAGDFLRELAIKL